ncbi:MAG: hypothetical protein ACLFQV_10980 [Vulcanimicrobiota bacterium]
MPDYMESVPTCPTAGHDTYYGGYITGDDESRENFTLYCQGKNHKDWVLSPGNYPRFSSKKGFEMGPYNEKATGGTVGWTENFFLNFC